MTIYPSPTQPSPRSINGAAEIHYFTCWPAIGEADAADVIAFWQREGAIQDPAQASERVKQIVMLARDAEGDIAGVCTALAATPAQLGQPMYYWRTFVGAAHRGSSLAMGFLKRSSKLLEEYARANDFPCIGILLELENDGFRLKGRKAIWFNPAFVYIGKSPRNLEVRVLYFMGARLK